MIMFAAGLSFLGLGAQPPTSEWGIMLSEGHKFIRLAPHASILPGLAIFLVVLSLNLLGDGLRDALDPRRTGEHVSPLIKKKLGGQFNNEDCRAEKSALKLS
jgi:ABC-type dipeptide/oligopeptide/nickel transport system permease subunit